eukprot:5720647-Pleurochrysis_carterae.AAC.2
MRRFASLCGWSSVRGNASVSIEPGRAHLGSLDVLPVLLALLQHVVDEVGVGAEDEGAEDHERRGVEVVCIGGFKVEPVLEVAVARERLAVDDEEADDRVQPCRDEEEHDAQNRVLVQNRQVCNASCLLAQQLRCRQRAR